MTYTPSDEILDAYANVLVNYGLNDGKGVNPGQNVVLRVWDSATPILAALERRVLMAGANPIRFLSPDGLERQFFAHADEKQVGFVPKKLLEGLVEEADCVISIYSQADPRESEGVSTARVNARSAVRSYFSELIMKKVDQGKLTWTLGSYGTPAIAQEAKQTIEQYWANIARFTYLNEVDPVQKWKDIQAQVEDTRDRLTALEIDELRVESEGTDLTIGLGENRRWLGGGGSNIPSYEIFVSPDHRRTRGHISFSEPLFRYGRVMRGIRFEFADDGTIVNPTADEGQDFLRELISGKENANKVGEFSLTDVRVSPIDTFMANTLFDENTGGTPDANGNRFGNTHIAFGRAYRDSYKGDVASVDEDEWDRMGFNSSREHTDVFDSRSRMVTARLKDGTTKIIYEGGQFTI